MSPRRPSPATVKLVVERDSYACVICGASIYGLGPRGTGWSIHHRRPRGMGGSKLEATNGPANLLTLCGHGTAGCHGRVERDRAEAFDNGWLVPSYGFPAAIPVLVAQGTRWVYLDAYGHYEAAPPPALRVQPEW